MQHACGWDNKDEAIQSHLLGGRRRAARKVATSVRAMDKKKVVYIVEESR